MSVSGEVDSYECPRTGCAGTVTAGLRRHQAHGMPGNAIGVNLAATPTPEQEVELRALAEELGVEPDALWRACILLHAMPPYMHTFIRTASDADYEREMGFISRIFAVKLQSCACWLDGNDLHVANTLLLQAAGPFLSQPFFGSCACKHAFSNG